MATTTNINDLYNWLYRPVYDPVGQSYRYPGFGDATPWPDPTPLRAVPDVRATLDPVTPVPPPPPPPNTAAAAAALRSVFPMRGDAGGSQNGGDTGAGLTAGGDFGLAPNGGYGIPASDIWSEFTPFGRSDQNTPEQIAGFVLGGVPGMVPGAGNLVGRALDFTPGPTAQRDFGTIGAVAQREAEARLAGLSNNRSVMVDPFNPGMLSNSELGWGLAERAANDMSRAAARGELGPTYGPPEQFGPPAPAPAPAPDRSFFGGLFGPAPAPAPTPAPARAPDLSGGPSNDTTGGYGKDAPAGKTGGGDVSASTSADGGGKGDVSGSTSADGGGKTGGGDVSASSSADNDGGKGDVSGSSSTDGGSKGGGGEGGGGGGDPYQARGGPITERNRVPGTGNPPGPDNQVITAQRGEFVIPRAMVAGIKRHDPRAAAAVLHAVRAGTSPLTGRAPVGKGRAFGGPIGPGQQIDPRALATMLHIIHARQAGAGAAPSMPPAGAPGMMPPAGPPMPPMSGGAPMPPPGAMQAMAAVRPGALTRTLAKVKRPPPRAPVAARPGSAIAALGTVKARGR